MVVNFSQEEIELPKATVLGVAEETSASILAAINEKESLSVSQNGKTPQRVSTAGKDTLFQQYLRDRLGHLNPEERPVLEPVLVKYRHVFHREGSNEFRGTDLAEHKIITGNARPIRKSPYRVPFALRKEMDNQIKDMLNKGVVEESSSPWASPAILVPKRSPDGTPKYRFCVDFRAFYAVTQFDTYPLPLLEETVSTLHGSKYFSVLDCYSGFCQVKIAEEDKLKTAFSTPSGHYHFKRLPYGLSNSPASFQRLMGIVLRDLTGTECWVFIDDLILFSDTIEEHTRRLKHVLQRLDRANLQLQPAKCNTWGM
jgi:hypothetical protein